MKMRLRHGLPFVEMEVVFGGQSVRLGHVLVDTGSAGTLVAIDAVAGVQIEPRPEDRLRTIRGVGGVEAVFTRRVDRLEVGEAKVEDFEIEVGGMDYGFEIDGIIGTDFLLRSRAIIDMARCELMFEKGQA
ncbi:MAG: hypothetical protein HC897_04250 [Thermoanaerobaculia bacterium]|nr:hypothetical protein [Thermoanaerobaculia bacterium]